MPLSLEQLRELPSPFYRAAVKALVLDGQNRLLVVINKDDEVELPGGGWEHGESLEACVRRETKEELGVDATNVSPVQFVFTGHSDHGWEVLRLVVRAELASYDFVPGDDMIGTKFVTKDELPHLNFDLTDAGIVDYIGMIWSQENK